jgi:exonuclease III
MDHIIEELKRCDPDVVCFQEATKYSITHFKGDDFINFKYDMMHDPKVEDGYGDVVLIKKAIKECLMAVEPYPETNMNRRMTRVYLPYFECEVCTTHLESIFKRDNASYLENNTKHNQLKILLKEMSQSKAKNVIIAGDFNVGDEDEDTFANALASSSEDLRKLAQEYRVIRKQLMEKYYDAF